MKLFNYDRWINYMAFEMPTHVTFDALLATVSFRSVGSVFVQVEPYKKLLRIIVVDGLRCYTVSPFDVFQDGNKFINDFKEQGIELV
jgi:hypothetical protein